MQAIQTIQTIRCPNCGSQAERHYVKHSHVSRTQCSNCDYLLVSCTITGKVLEAYAPSITTNRYKQIRLDAFSEKSVTVHTQHRLPIPVNSGR